MPRKFKHVPGQGYGAAKAQEQHAEATDAANPDDRMARLRAAAQQMQVDPVGMGPPTPQERQRFPETAGLPFGRGPGPEANQILPVKPPEMVSEEQQAAASLLPLLERLSDSAGASSTLKRLTRSLRAQSVTGVKGRF